MKTNLMIVVVLMAAMVSFAANAEVHSGGAVKPVSSPYFTSTDPIARMEQCFTDISAYCGAGCLGKNYDEGRCPQVCFRSVLFCGPEAKKQKMNPTPNVPSDAGKDREDDSRRLQGEAADRVFDLIAMLSCNASTYAEDPIVAQVCGLDEKFWAAHKVPPKSVWRAISAHSCCLAVFNARLTKLETVLANHIAADDARDASAVNRIVAVEIIHNNVGGPEAELAGHPELARIDDAEAFIREKSDDDLRNEQQELNQLFKFEIGALALGSTDFRDTGIIAGALQIAINFGVTENFRFTANGAVGGGKGREGNAVWACGATTEFILNQKGTVWLGPAVSFSNEGSTDRNFNKFLGAGATLRVIFPENGHGYFAVTALIGDNMHFIPDVTGEYDEVLHHHVGAGLQFAIGFSAFRDPK